MLCFATKWTCRQSFFRETIGFGKKEPNKSHFHSNETTEYDELNEDLTGNSVEDNKKFNFLSISKKNNNNNSHNMTKIK